MRTSFILYLGSALGCLLLKSPTTIQAQEYASLYTDTPSLFSSERSSLEKRDTLSKKHKGETSPSFSKDISQSSSQTHKESKEVSYVPKIDGAVKAKFEVSTYDGEYRFNVRNSRFGVSGNVSRHMIYRMQVDFNNEGKVSILDAYAGYQFGGWDIRLGQQQYHFSTDLDRGPSSNMFANRSFLSKYLTSYYGSELSDGKPKDFVKTLGSRDLGVMATYTFKTRLPLKLYFGIFNGSGINNPQWGKSVNLIGRVEIGLPIEGMRLALAYYDGSAPPHDRVIEKGDVFEQVPFKQAMRIGGMELCYARGNFFIEGEYARRYLANYNGKYQVLVASHVHTYYLLPMRSTSAMTHIAPIIRWDLGNGLDYLNEVSKQHERIDANRITAGINFGFGKKFLRSEVRLNYEKYLFREPPSDLSINKLFQDKFTVELVASF